jgi:hypothetical protein
MNNTVIISGDDFVSHLRSKATGIFNIKLRAILEYGQKLGLEAAYRSQLPPIGMGSITLVDQVVLILLIKLVNPKKIIEIGTFKGFSTRLFLDNCNDECEVITIDLPSEYVSALDATNEERARLSGDYNDDYLRLIQLKEGRPHLRGLSEEQKDRLILVSEDSTKLDFLKSFGQPDLVFIDGGHVYEIVENDSLQSERAMNKGVIIWHDFGSKIHDDVNKYLLQRSKDIKIFHVENSLVAFTFVNMEF